MNVLFIVHTRIPIELCILFLDKNIMSDHVMNLLSALTSALTTAVVILEIYAILAIKMEEFAEAKLFTTRRNFLAGCSA